MAANGKHESNWFWPKIVDISSAREAAKAGYWATLLIAAITVVFATVALVTGNTIMTIDPWAYLDAVLFAFLAWRIKKYSRVFSVVAVVLFVAEKVVLAQTQGAAGWPLAMILLLMLVNGARGVFGVHRFVETPTGGSTSAEDK